MKNSIRLFLILVLLNAYQTACKFETYEEKRAKEEQAREARLAKEEAKRNQAIAELKTTHNADDTWDKGSVAWTAELQDRLVRPDGRPIVGIARLRDVEKWDKQYRVYLVHQPFVALIRQSFEGPSVEFRLRCFKPERHGEARTGYLRGYFLGWDLPDYVFAAKIHAVKREDVLAVDVQDREGDTWLDSRPQFVAEGECLALKELTQEKPPPSERTPTGRPTPTGR